ncbi:MAG: alpha-glucosidase [Lachnospiraceae bacterium]|nr:alpha-glucosidase [Lachnospiraceae bacterium]
MGNKEWWKKAVIYQIYPRSFADSNGDGIGDIPGIISKLDHLQDLGINVIWLSPIYASPNEDNGYDISDYLSIHPDYGTMDDFDELVREAKARGISIVMDLVINHTSTEHEWFQKSRQGIEPYKNYYYWSDTWAGTPNNWTGFFGGSCWEKDDVRGASYLHLFAPHQADLNFHEPKVFEEVEKILRFWLEKGVRGFRCDVINVLYKDNLANGKKKLVLTGSEHYLSLPGTHDILHKIHKILAEYDAFTVGETVFVDTKEANLLTAPEREELNMVFGFEHMEIDQIIVKWFHTKFHWDKFIKVLARWQKEVQWNSLYFENHDQPRSVSRFGSKQYPEDSAKLLATLLLTLRGTPFIFEGQEIGMRNFDFDSMDEIRDVESLNIYGLLSKVHVPARLKWYMIRHVSRDNARTPMQWDDSANAGFMKNDAGVADVAAQETIAAAQENAAEPWLGINSNYKEINVKAQQEDPASVLHYYKKLIRFRKEQADLLEGDFDLLAGTARYTLYRRGSLYVLLNHSDMPLKMKAVRKLLPSTFEVLFSTHEDGANPDGVLAPWQAMILR